MSELDRKKWDRKYCSADPYGTESSRLLADQQHWLPTTGRALDLAGGSGRHALWLAHRGLDVTLTDISAQGLQIARQRAEAAGLQIGCVDIDLEEDPFPSGPWDVVVSCLYLYRPLFRSIQHQLATGGVLVVIQPTRKNLERHTRPPERFLLKENELRQLAHGLTILHYEESWSVEGRHDAVMVAQRESGR
jgi:tellurite methyltransferase